MDTVEREKAAKDFHEQVMAVVGKRQDDIKDPAELERFKLVMGSLGEAAAELAKDGVEPHVVGRAMLFYARCLRHAYGDPEAVEKRGIVPEAKA